MSTKKELRLIESLIAIMGTFLWVMFGLLWIYLFATAEDWNWFALILSIMSVFFTVLMSQTSIRLIERVNEK